MQAGKGPPLCGPRVRSGPLRRSVQNDAPRTFTAHVGEFTREPSRYMHHLLAAFWPLALWYRPILPTRTSVTRCAATSGTAVSVAIACGDAFDERLAWLCSLKDIGGAPLLRVEEIGPADAPDHARVAGAGASLWLTRDTPAAPLVLRLPATAPVPDIDGMPMGCGAEPCEDIYGLVDRALPLPLEPLKFEVGEGFLSRASDESGAWGVGRAGMLYRDLLPGRAGGAMIASHIRIPSGGPVPDYVHFHRVHFQLIVCVEGWVEVVYEGQGGPFVLEPCVSPVQTCIPLSG